MGLPHFPKKETLKIDGVKEFVLGHRRFSDDAPVVLGAAVVRGEMDCSSVELVDTAVYNISLSMCTLQACFAAKHHSRCRVA